MSARAFLGISHTPLLGLNPIAEQVELSLNTAIAATREKVLAFAPDLVVLFGPDHYNGFFNDLMPPFCIGTQAESVGDYLTPSGSLSVDAPTALRLTDALLDADFDIALSHRMQVDHGFAQPLQLLWGSLATPPVVPIFVNAASPPVIARMRRCRALGQVIGQFFQADPRRILFMGSGGLSHEPPVPTMENPDPAVRERITVRSRPTREERDAKTKRVMAAGMSLAREEGLIKPLNPQWDKAWMDALAGDDAAVLNLCAMPESTIAQEGGRSAHESKNWLLGRSALQGRRAPTCVYRFYQSIPEYIAGFGILLLEQNT